MILSRGESTEAQAPGHGDRNGAAVGRAVSELAGWVVAPAVGRPGGGARARVASARG